ncbi:Regulator of nonsense transcripts 3A [Geodia barretti]|uniref:Regulator of nonsense transcripts 3A n=1 Tax=Geodia barretti TaxID=519541 RepID=A0AA35XFN0_GEOBA|nr:Regulator of nonsense transcripts 3A [Geodia barretti]
MAAEQRVSKRVERELHQTKVVVRHLPPDFDQEAFMEAFSPGLPEGSFNYLYFAPGDPEFGPNGCARAYVNFTDESAILTFRDQFDGMVLESKSGGGQKYRDPHRVFAVSSGTQAS